MDTLKIIGFVFLGWVGLSLMLFGGAAFRNGTVETGPPVYPAHSSGTRQTQTPRAARQITMDQFQRISPGMSYDQVKNILGSDGELMSENYVEGIPGVMESIHTYSMSWKNPNGSNILIVFQNDRVNTRSQFGLK